MTKQEFTNKFIELQQKMYNAMLELNNIQFEKVDGVVDPWNETSDNNAYPFNESFDDKLSEMQEWIWATKNKNGVE